MNPIDDPVDEISLLLTLFKDTPFVELFEIMGWDTTKKFIRVFGGTTIPIPSRHDLNKVARDVEIYRTIQQTRTDTESLAVVKAMCKKYDLTPCGVIHQYNRIRRLFGIGKTRINPSMAHRAAAEYATEEAQRRKKEAQDRANHRKKLKKLEKKRSKK